MEMRDRRREARLQREKDELDALKKKWHNPHWFAWVFIVVAVSFLFYLSAWQIQRLWWKQGLIAKITSYQLTQALPNLPEDEAKLKDMGFQRVILQGEFLHDDEIHLAARYYNSQLGYHILTPFQLNDGRIALVNRGWVKADDKENKARINVTGKQTIITMIRTDNDRNYFTPEHDALKNIWFWRNLQAVEVAKGYDLIPVNFDLLYARNNAQNPIPSDGLVMVRNDHLGYAITWFLIGISGIVIFFFRHYYVNPPVETAKNNN